MLECLLTAEDDDAVGCNLVVVLQEQFAAHSARELLGQVVEEEVDLCWVLW